MLGLVRSAPAPVVQPALRTVHSRLGDYPLLWLALLYTVVSGLLLALALGSIRQQAIDTGQRTLAAFTRVIEEMTTRSLETAHVRLELASEEIRRLGPAPDPAATRNLLNRHVQAMPFANSMWVMDANGRVIAGTAEGSAGLDGSDRDYFTALRNGGQDRLAIGRPAVGAALKRMRVPLAHTVHDQNGQFRGVVVVGIDPEYFAAAWSSVDLGPEYVVAVFRTDRTLMLRSPEKPAELGQRFSDLAIFNPPLQGRKEGHFHKPSDIDGVPRYFAFRALQLWPDLQLVVGQADSVILGPWNRMATIAALVWALAAAAVAGLSYFLHRSRVRHASAEQRALVLGTRLDMATSAAAIGAWEWDMQTDLAYATPGYYTMLGYPPREGVIDRQFWLDRCHPDDRDRARSNIADALADRGDNYQYDVRLRHADGDYRWTRLVGRVTERGPDGRPLRIMGVRLDVHQQKLAEESLRHSEALNLAVLNSVQAQLAVLDPAGRVVALNEPWREAGQIDRILTGTGEAPIAIGTHYHNVYEKLRARAPDTSVLAQAGDGIQAVLERRTPGFSISYPCRMPQGNRWFSLQVTPLHQADGGAVIAHTDITDRMAAEDKLRQLMRMVALRTAINRAIIGQRERQGLLQEICRVAIAHGQFAMAWIGQADPASGRIRPLASAGADNSFLARMVDPADGRIDAAALPLPRSPSDVHTTADIASQAQSWPVWVAEALQRGYRSAATVGFACDGWQDGSVHLFAQAPGFFLPEERQVLRDIGRDIALAVAALGSEAAREKAELALHSLLRDKEALLKEVHHRVKNNLQVVSSLLRLEAAREVAPSTVSVLRDMQGRIQAMALLHESLYGSGNFAAVDLAAYLRKLATQAFATFSTRTGAIHLHLALDPVEVSMDQAITCGLLVNELVSNSLKHAFPDGRTGVVGIALQALDGPGRMRLQVFDDGVGLPGDLPERQVRSLGLQLATDLASQLGGALERGAGPGAVFHVDFQVDNAP